jgi:hypothetical protein
MLTRSLPRSVGELLARFRGCFTTRPSRLFTPWWSGSAAEFLVTVKQVDDLFTMKANKPTLPDRCAGLPWHQVPVLDRTRDQAHGRVRSAPSRRSRSVGSASRTPLRSSRSPARPAICAPAGGTPRPSTRSPA